MFYQYFNTHQHQHDTSDKLRARLMARTEAMAYLDTCNREEICGNTYNQSRDPYISL